MQYGADVSRYKKINIEKNKELNISLQILSILGTVLIGFLLSRINVKLAEGLVLAPFGVGYLMCIANGREKGRTVITAVSVAMGYLTTYSTENKSFIYLVLVGFICMYSVIVQKIDENSKRYIVVLVPAIYTAIGVFLGEQGILMNLIFSLISGVAIIVVMLILNQGIKCFEEVKTEHIFSTEELISMALVICLAVSGMGNINILNIDMRNIVALSIVIAVAYSCGSGIGTILGVIMGISVGIASNDIIMSIALYSVCGLVVGIFNVTNKVIAMIAYFTICFIMSNYSNGVIEANILNIVIAGIVLLIIPKEIFRAIFKEVNSSEKYKNSNNNQLEGIKDEFVEKIDNLRGILFTLANGIDSLSGNDKLLIKSKSVAMVENLADRVCYNCEMNEKCWNRELHNTFNSFGNLIRNYKNKNMEIPQELTNKCVKVNTLVKNADEIISVHSVNETVRKRLVEGRKLISGQINNISMAISDIINDFDEIVDNCYEVDVTLKKMLNKKNIDFNEVYSYKDRLGRVKIKIKAFNKHSENYYIKTILPIVSNLIKVPVSLAEEGFKINPISNECTIIIEETPKYHIESYAAFKAKDGEDYSGDSFSFGKNKKGLYITAISDGMGSGPEASIESEATIRIIEKFMEFGFDENTAINSINSIMGMKFNESEQFTTLDMNAIDLYTGDIYFTKVGGVASFIKRESGVDVIESFGLPFGIVDSIEVDTKKDKVTSGDIIISISDGIVDMDKNNTGDYEWVKTYLKSSTSNPEKLSRGLLEEAKKRSLNKLTDDMTVVVSKVYSV